jgi:capsular polysaccharide export protein
MRGYRYPYTVSIHGQVFGHTRRYAVSLATRKARARQAERVARLTPYFLVCLQREGDSQLMVHSELKTNRALMETVIASFAAHAPADVRLVIKNHPLDPGLTDLEREAGFGTPVKLLGRAFFDIPGLVDQQPLEAFWSEPAKPDHDLFLRFRRRMSVQTQIYGSYHNPRSLTGTADRLAERLLA